MANYIATDTDLTAVADAIRSKGGKSGQLAFPQGFVDAIDGISGGEEIYSNPNTGAQYTKIIDINLSSFKPSAFGARWRYCSELEQITAVGVPGAMGGGYGDYLSDCPKLKKAVLPSFGSSSTFVFRNDAALEEAQLGNVGKGVTSLAKYTFSGCTNANLVITIYVADTTEIPLAEQPWGATNATIIYRSSTTGEVRTV